MMDAGDCLDDFEQRLAPSGKHVAIMVLIASDGNHRVWADGAVMAAASWKEIAETIATVAADVALDPVAGHA